MKKIARKLLFILSIVIVICGMMLITTGPLYAGDTFKITVNCGANGKIAAPPGEPQGGSYEVNVVKWTGSQEFIVTGNPGYHIESITVFYSGETGFTPASIPANPSSPFTCTFTTVSNASSWITATFAEDNPGPFTITVNAGANGTITPETSSNIAKNSTPTYAIAANPGYHIESITVDGGPVAIAPSYTFAAVITNHIIAATFAEDNPGPFTITVNAGAGGTILPVTSSSIAKDSTPMYTIAANPGYHIVGVTVDTLPVTLSAANTYTFSAVKTNHTIAATFAEDNPGPFTITVTAGPNGSITGPSNVPITNGTGSEIVLAGATPSFTIAADEDYHIASLIVDGGPDLGSLPSPYGYQFNAINDNTHSIAATFAEDGNKELRIDKVVTGGLTYPGTKDFTFNVTDKSGPLPDVIVTVTANVDGSGSGSSAVIPVASGKAHLIITEIAASALGYTVTPGTVNADGSVTQDKDNVTVSGNKGEEKYFVKFTNALPTTPATGSITVTKILAGDLTTGVFTFGISRVGDSWTYNGPAVQISFPAALGDNNVFSGLDLGHTYIITETGSTGTNISFTTASDPADGNVTINREISSGSITFTNTGTTPGGTPPAGPTVTPTIIVAGITEEAAEVIEVEALTEEGTIEVAGIQELPRTGNNMLFYVIGFALIAIGAVFGSFFIPKALRKREN